MLYGRLKFMSLVITRPTITTAGSKQFNSELITVFTGYQVKDTLITQKLYTNNSSAYPATAVATGTFAVQSTNFPLAGDLYNTIYNPSNTSLQTPLVGVRNDYTRVTAASANDGIKYSVSWNMTLSNFAVIVVKSTGTSVAGKVKFRSSASNESVCSFTTSATANTWEKKIFEVKRDTSPGVALTGTPVFSSITELEITLDATGSADVAMIYGVNNYSQIIGEKVVIPHRCTTEAEFENTLEAADLLCGQQVEQKTGNGRNVQFTLGSKKKDIESQGIAMGDIVRLKSGYFLELLNDENVGAKTVAAGTITLPAGLKVANVYIEGVGNLKEYHTATGIPEGAYHYTSTTLTLNTLYNSTTPVIYIWNQSNKITREIRNLELGYVGFLQVPRKTESGKYEYITSKKAQVMLNAEGYNDDFDQVNFMYSVYPQNGVYAEIANDG